MKQLIVLGVVLALVGGGVALWIGNSVNSNKGEMLGLAVSPLENGQQRLHIVVSMGMLRNDPPRPGTGMANDLDWIAKKFVVRETATATVVPLTKAGHSDLISEQKAANPEFFIEGRLKPKTQYTLEFKRWWDDAAPYRYEFTTRDDGLPFSREVLKLVQKR